MHGTHGWATGVPASVMEAALGVEAAAWGKWNGQIGGGDEWQMPEAEEAEMLREPVTAEGDLSFLADGWYDSGQEQAAGDESVGSGDGGADEWDNLSGRERSGGYGYGADETEYGAYAAQQEGTEEGDLVLMD